MELSETEREELMACEFVVISGYGTFPGLLVDIDRDIGLTIVNKDNTDHYLICHIGDTVIPSKTPEEAVMYNELFDLTVEGIRTGTISLRVLEERMNSFQQTAGNNPSSEACAFNQ